MTGPLAVSRATQRTPNHDSFAYRFCRQGGWQPDRNALEKEERNFRVAAYVMLRSQGLSDEAGKTNEEARKSGKDRRTVFLPFLSSWFPYSSDSARADEESGAAESGAAAELRPVAVDV